MQSSEAQAGFSIEEGGRELVRLIPIGYSDGMKYREFQAEFVGITLEDWERAYAQDPRDVAWTVRDRSTGDVTDLCRWDKSWQADKRVIGLKWTNCFSTTKPGVGSILRRLFRLPMDRVSREKAPVSWEKLSKRSVSEHLASGDRLRVAVALSDIGCLATKSDAKWASDLLLQYSDSDDYACEVAFGLGELARRHGYANQERAIPILQGLLSHRMPGIRKSAAKALDEIGRFTNEGAWSPVQVTIT